MFIIILPLDVYLIKNPNNFIFIILKLCNPGWKVWRDEDESLPATTVREHLALKVDHDETQVFFYWFLGPRTSKITSVCLSVQC